VFHRITANFESIESLNDLFPDNSASHTKSLSRLKPGERSGPERKNGYGIGGMSVARGDVKESPEALRETRLAPASCHGAEADRAAARTSANDRVEMSTVILCIEAYLAHDGASPLGRTVSDDSRQSTQKHSGRQQAGRQEEH
jgi:hypothetical protein